MEVSAAVAAGRLSLLGSGARRNLNPHRLPSLIHRRPVASATAGGPLLPRRPSPFSSLSCHSHRLHGAAAPERFAASSLHSVEGYSHAWEPLAPPPGEWVADAPHGGAPFDEGAVWTAVLLGWLGAEHKHLRRYVDIYRGRGMRTVSFVVPVGELFLDLGRGVEGRTARFAGELAAWAEGTEPDGRERRLLFHTFSNTGWYTYGAILGHLRSRGDVIQNIKGCVIDSGADAELDPQVWAAGFCAALLKKRSSLTYASVESIEGIVPDDDKNRLMMPDARPDCVEFILLSILKKLFALILGLPDINRKLNKIISTLSSNQPPCPQLYLYSSADRVIPVQSVERFIQMSLLFCSTP